MKNEFDIPNSFFLANKNFCRDYLLYISGGVPGMGYIALQYIDDVSFKLSTLVLFAFFVHFCVFCIGVYRAIKCYYNRPDLQILRDGFIVHGNFIKYRLRWISIQSMNLDSGILKMEFLNNEKINNKKHQGVRVSIFRILKINTKRLKKIDLRKYSEYDKLKLKMFESYSG